MKVSDRNRNVRVIMLVVFEVIVYNVLAELLCVKHFQTTERVARFLCETPSVFLYSQMRRVTEVRYQHRILKTDKDELSNRHS